jgi:hypothetical protein
MRTLAMPKTAEPWSLTSLREKLIKIGGKVVSHGGNIDQSKCSGVNAGPNNRLFCLPRFTQRPPPV